MKHIRGLIIAPIMALLGCMATKQSLNTSFNSDVCIKPLSSYHYLTCCDIQFTVDDMQFTIPKDFETDLASIPKLVWPVLAPAHSSLIRPAIVHDWFYRKTCEFSRSQTDLIFYHMLRNDGVSRARANIMYYAVRTFGWLYYKKEYCDDGCNEMDKRP